MWDYACLYNTISLHYGVIKLIFHINHIHMHSTQGLSSVSAVRQTVSFTGCTALCALNTALF